MSSSDVVRSRLRHFIQHHGLAGSTLVIAVSGGPDSVCLLHALTSLKNELCLSLHVAHLDHGLRGAESDADAEFVMVLAEGLDIPATVGHADVKALQKARKLTIEEAAREARYAFLAGVARDIGTDLVMTGHTRNDNVETILMHIIRGSGLRGLVGLKPLTAMTFDEKCVRIARSILDITRADTTAYCQENRLDPRTDSSNLDTSFLRNKVRLKLIPQLEKYNSDFAGSLLSLSSSAADELEYLDNQAEELGEKSVSIENNLVTIDRSRLKDVDPALLRHLLRYCFEKLPGGLKDVESRHIEDMLSLRDKPAGSRIDLPHGLVFMAAYDKLWLGREEALPCPYPSIEGEHRLTLSGITVIPGWRVESKIVGTFDRDDNPLVAHLDMDNFGRSAGVRTRQRGDRFYPMGLGSEKKLGEFMIAAKIPRLWRKNIPVVVTPGGIAWLVGYRLDERVKVTARTKKILKLEFTPD
jgi:tRNA(Ile)-lysidine synthase